MAQLRISQHSNDGLYFLTPTVWNWYYIFDRHNRWEILADSLRYCQQTKGLLIYAYVFMLNHLHLIIQAPDVAGVIRDFKRHSAKEVKKNIERTEPKVMALFSQFSQADGGFKFWKADNAPKLIETDAFLAQKVEYIHHNPVRKGYVDRPEHWRWSSANPNSEIEVVKWF